MTLTFKEKIKKPLRSCEDYNEEVINLHKLSAIKIREGKKELGIK